VKKTFNIILLSGICNFTFGQFPVSVDSLYTFIKYNSALRHSVNWDQVDSLFQQKIEEAKTLQDTMNSFVLVLEKLNDVHSQIFLDNQFYGHYPSFDEAQLQWLKLQNDKAIKLTNQIYIELLPHKIGYIRIPGIQVQNQQEINYYAQKLYDSIAKLEQSGSEAYIIDLRFNGGGNVYPMLTGISSFLGDQLIAFETDPDDHVVRKWEIENGNFIIGGYQTTQISVDSTLKLETVPIAVLTGAVTKSAGSMVAIALKKRPNTIFIGEPTAEGYSTSNGFFQFAPNLTLNFATNFVADREKYIYKSSVIPDISIYRGDNFQYLQGDQKIKTAIEWLSNSSK
jgi:carboxyl-terminal processing protease